ncbi:polysaccharide deacetylase [Fibrobacteres bacterium R8-0-B4]
MNPMTAITAAATVAAAPLLAGAAAAALTPLFQRRRVSPPPVTGLLIHSVYDKPQLNLSGISKNTFGAILDRLKNNNTAFITVSRHVTPQSLSMDDSLSTVDTRLRVKPAMTGTPTSAVSTIPTATTAITFDDGLISFYDNAYPMLEERGIKSTVFPVAGLIGKTGNWDVIGKTRHLTAAMLREIAESGHEIGSHSLTHANLIWLNDDELRKELRDSKSILEDITGTAVRSLSFPFGSWNKRVWEAAKSEGYEYATAYRGHRHAQPEFLPVFGVYRFDFAADAVDRAISIQSMPSATSKAFASLMSHFCKGTPLVKFRKTYRLFPQPSPPAPTCAERS